MATAKNKAGAKKKPSAARRPRTATDKPKPAPRPGAATGKPRQTTEKLTVVRPSGAKDDSFFELVHEVARQIPRGRVTSYGAIAACLGTRMSARLVGWAMNSSGSAKKPVPAHRVVNRNGLLTGKHHFNPPSLMEALLKKEGIEVKEEKVIDFDKLFWDPAQELL
jgi:methylated-DNA-protein-cysteine methyltransferase-like protein